jgi:hypothetical protein
MKNIKSQRKRWKKMARPCEEGKKCRHETFDYSENCNVCDIDFDGESCPYIKPYGKKKYREEQREKHWEKFINSNIILWDTFETDPERR